MSAWPRNLKGGFKVTTLPLRRKRHDGIRCYGEHRGSKCWPYDFSRNPALPQARLVLHTFEPARAGMSHTVDSCSVCTQEAA